MRGKPAQTIDETTQPSIPSILWIIRWPGLEHLVWVESDETKMETLGTLRRWWALNEDGFVEQAPLKCYLYNYKTYSTLE